MSHTITELDAAQFSELVDAVAVIDPQPRKQRWVSLCLCIVDAVWSIGAHYDNVVVPLVRNLAKELGVDQPTVPMSRPIDADPRWFKKHGVVVDPVGARELIAALVPAVSARLKRGVTAWEIDHAVWNAGRGM